MLLGLQGSYLETPCLGGVAGLLAACSSGGHAACVDAAPGAVGVVGSSGVGSGPSGRGYKRVRLSRKSPACEDFRSRLGDQPRPRVWKRLKIGVLC